MDKDIIGCGCAIIINLIKKPDNVNSVLLLKAMNDKSKHLFSITSLQRTNRKLRIICFCLLNVNFVMREWRGCVTSLQIT